MPNKLVISVLKGEFILNVQSSLDKIMKLSLITVTYNRPQAIAEKALPSVLEQQVKARDFEWIVVNDGGDRLLVAE